LRQRIKGRTLALLRNACEKNSYSKREIDFMSKRKMVPAPSSDRSHIIVEWEDTHKKVENSPTFLDVPSAQEWIDGPALTLRHPLEKEVKKKGLSFGM